MAHYDAPRAVLLVKSKAAVAHQVALSVSVPKLEQIFASDDLTLFLNRPIIGPLITYYLPVVACITRSIVAKATDLLSLAEWCLHASV